VQVWMLKIVEHVPSLFGGAEQMTCQRDSNSHLACALWTAKHDSVWQMVVICQIAKAISHFALSYDIIECQVSFFI
jgi:hypothetical protein